VNEAGWTSEPPINDGEESLSPAGNRTPTTWFPVPIKYEVGWTTEQPLRHREVSFPLRGIEPRLLGSRYPLCTKLGGHQSRLYVMEKYFSPAGNRTPTPWFPVPIVYEAGWTPEQPLRDAEEKDLFPLPGIEPRLRGCSVCILVAVPH
jgi:hypothetical protein